MFNKKYLITNGCSFTGGHKLGVKGSWATHLAQDLDLDLINLGLVGGSGNEIITQNTINYATITSNIAKDSLFVIQLSECLRYLVNWDGPKDDSLYWHLTPQQFIRNDGFDGWDLDFPINKAIYDSRNHLAQFYTNITFSLIRTYWYIINFVNFCDNNDYPYLIFDGINNHIPYEENEKWYLDGSTPGDEKFEIKVSNEINFKEFVARRQSAILHINLIDYIKDLKYYHNSPTLYNFIHNRDNDDYYKGNQGHPNELGAKMWAKHLVGVLEEKFDEVG